nr:ORF120 [Acipenserid herpesvirus 1]
MSPVIEVARLVDCSLKSLKETFSFMPGALPDSVRVYYAHPRGLVKYIECHLTICLAYLGRDCLHTIKGVFYTYVNLSEKELEIFLTCLYMKYQNYIDQDNRVVHPHRINCTINQWILVLELACYYQLEWLCNTYERLKNECQAHRPGLCYRYNEEELLCVMPGQQDLRVISTPAFAKAFTMAFDETLYCVCAPCPTTRELWVKYSYNQWVLLSVVYRATPIHQTFQLTLAESTCLYILGDGLYLECYNMATRFWRKINLYTPPGVDHLLVEAGDGSVPGALLITNSHFSQVDIVKNLKTMWSMDTIDYNKMDTVHSRQRFYGDHASFDQPDYQQKFKAAAYYHTPSTGLLDSIKKSILNRDCPKARLAQMNYLDNDVLTWPTSISSVSYGNDPMTTPLEPTQRWARALVIGGVVYARRECGDWLKLTKGWSNIKKPSLTSELVWNFSPEPAWVTTCSLTSKLASVEYNSLIHIVNFAHPHEQQWDDGLEVDACCSRQPTQFQTAAAALQSKPLSLVCVGYMDNFCNPHTVIDQGSSQHKHKLHRYLEDNRSELV